MNKISKEFFIDSPVIVAKNILGKIIEVGDKRGMIYETEAYGGLYDEASHAFPKKTLRNSLMYDSFGYVYVYLIYGMHYCLNFTADINEPGAILIRGIKDLNTGVIYDGPGKLTKFLGIDKTFNGLDISSNNRIILLDNGINFSEKDIIETTRIGIKKAIDKKWRFIINNIK